MMRIKIVYIIVFIICFCNFVQAGEINVKNPLIAVPSDVSAQQYSRTDKNDDLCALVKVRTRIKDMHFDSRLGISGNVEYKNGEYWIYLSYGERMLQVMHESVTRLDYLIPVAIESGQVYMIVIDAEIAGTTPAEPDLNGRVSVISSPRESVGATIKIDGKETGKTTPAMLTLHEGVYSVSLEKSEFEKVHRSILVNANEDLQVAFDMEKIDPLKQYRKNLKTQRIVSGILSVISLGSGIYCSVKGDQAYQDYQKATIPSNITDFKKKSQQFDTGALISYSVSVGSVAWLVTAIFKGNKVKQNK